jgi:hypothetical protein
MTTRRHPRFAITLEIQVRFDDADKALEAQLLNVSKDGLFVAMDPPRPVGTRVRVQLRTKGGWATVEGIVVRVQPDTDEPSTRHLPPGVGVFLTATDSPFERWCSGLNGKSK